MKLNIKQNGIFSKDIWMGKKRLDNRNYFLYIYQRQHSDNFANSALHVWDLNYPYMWIQCLTTDWHPIQGQSLPSTQCLITLPLLFSFTFHDLIQLLKYHHIIPLSHKEQHSPAADRYSLLLQLVPDTRTAETPVWKQKFLFLWIHFPR